MHAVLITFRSEVSKEDLTEPFTEYANAVTGVDGLVSKTWIADGDVLGGFHIFTSRQAADSRWTVRVAGTLGIVLKKNVPLISPNLSMISVIELSQPWFCPPRPSAIFSQLAIDSSSSSCPDAGIFR